MSSKPSENAAFLNLAPPAAAKKKHSIEIHGEAINDDYHWLRDSGYPEVKSVEILDYLRAENGYFEQFLAPHQALVDTLFEEFKGREQEKDVSVPFIDNGYEYRWEFAQGNNYKQYYRKNLKTGEDTLFLDQQALAKGRDYFVLGDWTISPDNRLLAYAIDTDGDERYALYIQDLATGEFICDAIEDVAGSLIFTAHNDAIVFAKLDPQKWTTRSINYCAFGASPNTEAVLFAEHDESFFMSASLSSSRQQILISTGNSSAREVHAVHRNAPLDSLQTLIDRKQKLLAYGDHGHKHFYFLVNDKHVNFRFIKVADHQAASDNWENIIEGSDGLYLKNFCLLDEHILVHLSEQGQDRIRVMAEGAAPYDIAFPEPVYSVSLGLNSQMAQSFIRVNYESMITPPTVYDFDLVDKRLILRKRKHLPSGYEASQYATQRLYAPSRDGQLIPVSIVYKKGFKQDASHPMHLYAYGAYGIGIQPEFSMLDLSLLDRGFSFAIAHIRGGDEMGYQWYLDGKLNKRQNTFNDFIDVANFLIEKQFVAKGNISISGRSAGGELMGAMVVQAPDLWRSVILGVPFVDVLNTMLDASLPLTPPEWEEWGNPLKDKEAFDVIKGYSPYDNIEARDYPAMLVTGGLNDPRVTYWEPAKWTAKMRNMKTNNCVLVMRMNMGAGHFANSGRYGRLKDYAQEMAFQLLIHDVET